MERKRVARGVSVIVIATSALALLALFVVFLLPPLTAQMTHLFQDIPAFRARVLDRIPARYPVVQAVIREIFAWSASPKTITLFERSFAWGQSAVSGLVTAAIVVVLTLYLLLDGKSLYAWLLAFVPRTHREKVATTMDEVSDVVHAYVSGQLLVAVLFAIFAAVLLTILGVPAAVPLAVIAGVCDVIPVLGILLAIVPAVLLALTVSPSTAAVVAIAYLGYHLVETYFILPRIYGNKLKISTLSVLLALLVGGRLQGIIGAVLVLPLVAAYPIIERHWLGGLPPRARPHRPQGARQGRRERQRRRHGHRDQRREARVRRIRRTGLHRSLDVDDPHVHQGVTGLARETALSLGHLVGQHVKVARLEIAAEVRAMGRRATVVAVLAVLVAIGYALAMAGLAVAIWAAAPSWEYRSSSSGSPTWWAPAPGWSSDRCARAPSRLHPMRNTTASIDRALEKVHAR